MRKIKMFVDMDKEEEYLNEMAKNGLLLEKYSSFGVYTFIKGDSIDLHYRVDYRGFKSKKEFEQYKILFEDAGWEHVSGTAHSGSEYFIPKLTNVGLSDIFSDTESKAARYKRFLQPCMLGIACALMYLVVVLSTSGFQLSNLGYLTPGLWEKTGADFWKAFLFETPFAVLRFLPLIIFTVLTILYGYWALKAYKLYKKHLKDNML